MVKHTLSTLGPKVLASRMVHDYVQQLYIPAAQSERGISADDYAAAREQAHWRGRIFGAWPGVAVVHAESSGVGEAPQVGSQLTVRATVTLGGLEESDVDVQAVFGRVDEADQIHEAESVSLTPVRDGDVYDEGSQRYEGDIPLARTGAFGYAVRVLPRSPALASPAELGLVTTS